MLSEFYAGIRHAGVSALTGEGVDGFFEVLVLCVCVCVYVCVCVCVCVCVLCVC